MSTTPPLTDEQLAEIRAELDRPAPHHFTRADVAALLAEVDRLRAERDQARAELAPYEILTAQQCPAKAHPDWLIDSENAHSCPWCEIDRLTTEIAEGIASQTMLKGLNMRDGQVHLEIEPAREILLILVASMRTMLDDAGAENYLETEATFPPAVHLDLQDGQHAEDSYTLTVQRRHRPTAHTLRRRAEAERDQVRDQLGRLVHALKTPSPAGSEHYRSGWADALDAAIDAIRATAGES